MSSEYVQLRAAPGNRAPQCRLCATRPGLPSFREIRTPTNLVRVVADKNKRKGVHPKSPGFRIRESGAGYYSSRLNNGCPVQTGTALKPDSVPQSSEERHVSVLT